MTVRTLFLENRIRQEDWHNLDELISSLKSKIGYLHDIAIDDIIKFLDMVGKSLEKSEVAKRNVGPSLKYLRSFLSKENLEIMLDTALRGNRKVLDEFVKLNDAPVLFHAQPRGLAVHWLAGNVPTLGIFSLVQSLLTKNVNLVKASSKAYDELLTLLELFDDVNTEKVKGSDILQTVAVVLAGSEQKEIHEKLSLAADIRVAWGGEEAIEAVLSYQKRFSTEDVVYGPKYSYAVIDKESLSSDFDGLAQRLAIDVSVFDQYACSSPHTVFIEKNGLRQPLEFAEELARKLELVNRTLIPKGAESADKAMEIHRIRAEYEFKGQVFSSKNTDWTVIYSEEQGLASPCFSRVVFVRPVEDITEIAEYSDRYKQTLGLAVDGHRRFEFVDKVTLSGIDRCPPLGTMSNFESPWDGMFGIDRMVRWITTSEN